jgi:N-[(2S)-2-amino-2-carboxyethyl]-L-glutamate dehydrogenase
MQTTSIPSFSIIGAKQITEWLEQHPESVFNAVKDAYLQHTDGNTVSPDSYFLRFPDSTHNRIIALPASIESASPITGIKWIASFPDNIKQGLDRASAVLIVNDRHTGYPRACLEGSLISAARTAASAVLGAHYLHPTPGRIKRLGVIGCGPIAYRTVALLAKLGWQIDELYATDLSEQRNQLFRDKCTDLVGTLMAASLEATITHSDMVLVATSATVPYITSPEWFSHAPTVLHMSLRDLAPEVILTAQNVADDVNHSLKAQTSTHLASQRVGHHEFMAGSIADVIRQQVVPDSHRARIFSPFGMGILDLAIARQLLETIDEKSAVNVAGFFPVPYVR